jgi:hypothetical protein
MKRSLLIAKVLCVGLFTASCQNSSTTAQTANITSTGQPSKDTVKKQATENGRSTTMGGSGAGTADPKKDSTRPRIQEASSHAAPEQGRIDSIKKEKLKDKK